MKDDKQILPVDKEYLNNLRHSTAHLLAAAVLQLYPDAKNAIGPSIENGFYQDFDFGDEKAAEEDLIKIENKMREILKSWGPFETQEVSLEQAKKDFAHNPYKLELIEEFGQQGKTITENNPGNFLDLCKGGHAENPAEELKNFKLLSLAGAYWRGSEKNKMLTRIYGTAFSSKEELENYLNMLEEAKKRDHKKLGRDLDLFFFHETSPGMVYWLPKGLVIYNTLYDYTRELYKKFGYQEVATPILNKKDLYETSGHWTHYKQDMFISDMGENELFGIKPMNCPNAMTIFGLKTRSYHELPLRLAETTLLHRFELSGTLNGLFRIREFRQDDAHMFMRSEDVEPEFMSLIEMVKQMYQPFDLTYKLRFGTRPEKFLGEASDWDKAEKTLKAVLEKTGLEFFVSPGEGAFYGPKVDILMKDSLGREWQTGTIQLDSQQPKRFNLSYADSDGTSKTPIVIHRAIYGSFERFLGILVEHYAGKFPTWLSPVQVKIIPIADRHIEYAKKVMDQLKKVGVRVELDDRSEKMQGKIRDAQNMKIPYMIILGDNEVNDQKISVRLKSGENKNGIKLDEFLTNITAEIDQKS